MKEELGIDVSVVQTIANFDDETPDLKIWISLMKCQIVRGKPQCLDCQDWGWFSLDAVETLTLAPADHKMFTWLKTHYTS